jgi:hypothetical protein
MTNRANHHNNPFYYGKPQQLSLSQRIGIASLVVAVLTIPVSVATPEIRCWLQLQSGSCPESIANKAEDFYQKGSTLLKLGRYVELSIPSIKQSLLTVIRLKLGTDADLLWKN